MEIEREGPACEEQDATAEEVGENVVGGGEIVGDEVMDEGPVAENLEGLSESEAGRVESHYLAMPLLLLHPHLVLRSKP